MRKARDAATKAKQKRLKFNQGRLSWRTWREGRPDASHHSFKREREERHSLNLLLCSFELVPCTLRLEECHSLLELTSFLCPLCVLTLRTANWIERERVAFLKLTSLFFLAFCRALFEWQNVIRFLSALLFFVHCVYSHRALRITFASWALVFPLSMVCTHLALGR